MDSRPTPSRGQALRGKDKRSGSLHSTRRDDIVELSLVPLCSNRNEQKSQILASKPLLVNRRTMLMSIAGICETVAFCEVDKPSVDPIM